MPASAPQKTGYHPLDVYGDTKRVTQIFHWFIAIILLCAIVGIVISFLTDKILSAIFIAVSLMPILASLVLIYFKKFESTSILLAVTLLSLMTLLATTGLGIHQISNLAFPAILIIASLVTRKRTLAFLTLFVFY